MFSASSAVPMPEGGIARAARVTELSREKARGWKKSPASTDGGVVRVVASCPVGNVTVSPPSVQYRLPDRPPEMSGGSRRGNDRDKSDLAGGATRMGWIRDRGR